MRLLNFSGAATKISGHVGAADYLFNHYGYRPDIITGISSGAIVTVPIAMRKWEALRYMTQNIKLSDIFDKSPVTKNNKIHPRAIYRAATLKSSFGTQNNLPITLSKIITEDDFERYQEGNYPHCYIASVDFKTGTRYIVNVKEKHVSYTDYLMLVNASASIPMAVEPVRFKGMLLYDGGARNHILSPWAVKNIEGITESMSVFSRPKEYFNVLDQDWTDEHLFSVVERAGDIGLIELSKKDEREEQYRAKERGIKLTQIFTPWLIKDTYDTDPVKQQATYEAGYKAAEKYLTQVT